EARLQKDLNEKMEASQAAAAAPSRKRRRWDQPTEGAATSSGADPASASSESGSDWDTINKKKSSRWDALTPVAGGSSRWDAPTPVAGAGGGDATPSGRHSRWDETPVANHGVMMTPNSAAEMQKIQMTPVEIQIARAPAEMAERNRPMSDEQL